MGGNWMYRTIVVRLNLEFLEMVKLRSGKIQLHSDLLCFISNIIAYTNARYFLQCKLRRSLIIDYW